MIRRMLLLCLFSLFGFTAFAQTTINGAGSTFINPMMQKWSSEYHNLHPDVQINYQSIGSGGGIRQLLAGTVDFGATDGPMTDEQLAQSKAKIVHIPAVIGSVVPAYNINGVNQELKFTGDVLAKIYLGQITTWNDAQIQNLNKDVKLPGTSIVVVHRAEASGTTYVWTDYLSKVSNDWKNGPGRAQAVKWPMGLGGKGNDGVAGLIRQTDGAIGYVELIYALQNHIAYGTVKNAAGKFVKGSLESTTAAAKGAKIPDDYRVSITNSPDPEAYPIASFSWLLVPNPAKDASKAKTIIDFLNWMLDKGQAMNKDLNYAPLPQDLNLRVRKTVATLH